MSVRDRRRNAIKRLIHEYRISSQEELVKLLASEGVHCTQATLSRDLRDMGIIRRNTPVGPVYKADKSAGYIEVLVRMVGMEILNVRHNGHMVVVRTLAGRAEGVAGFLDNWGHDNILGSVAGDDTVLVVPVDITKIEKLVADVRALEVLADT
ncbi:MAG: arginine repressor [Proteobacteria bacterium]|nr:arginine repressor [Pseudomonadota bacterium]MCP4919256.1 arginine repressor [Pseudomonadota bacterium]